MVDNKTTLMSMCEPLYPAVKRPLARTRLLSDRNYRSDRWLSD